MNELLQAVLRNLYDGDLRSVLADVVAEGFELTKFDKSYPGWVWCQDGLPYGFRSTAREWFGKRCDECNGFGVYHDYAADDSWAANDIPCSYCDSLGSTGGIAKEVCATQPIVTVVLSGEKPADRAIVGDRWSWARLTRFDEDPDGLFGVLFDLLTDGRYVTLENSDWRPWYRWHTYPYRKQAIADYRAASLNWGRKAAGLPLIAPLAAQRQ